MTVNDNSNDYAELKINNQIIKMPIREASIGQSVIDISKLYEQTGYFTYDPGFMSTAACQSHITFIDGDVGILRHRGYEIKTLAQECKFLEVAYLLFYGNLPTAIELDQFTAEVNKHTLVHEQLHHLYHGFKRSAHPMAIMVGAVGSLSAFYHDYLDITNPSERKFAAIRMIAKIPTLAAMAHKYTIGQPFIYPKNELDFTENLLQMMFAIPCENYKVNPIFVKALNQILILHADHEQNASTSTVRTAGSSGANPFACMSAGIASLWGPSHGGANEAVINMLKTIGSKDNIPKYIAKAKSKDDSFRLMGFGHRVYKNYDPRAAVLKDTCKQVFEQLSQKNPLLEIAIELENIALNDSYFIEKKLYPNVDFYSGIIYEAMGIPPHMFTVIFAVARSVGWMAQWQEMMDDKSFKIARPRQLYTGEVLRNFIEIDKR